METRKIITGLCAALALYGAYRLVSCALKSDEMRIREAVEELVVSFREGNRRAILARLTEDFEAEWRRRTVPRREIGDHLAYRFIRGERLILAGEVQSLTVADAAAVVVWNGEARWQHVSGTGSGSLSHRGLGTLRFRRREGDWLLERAVAEEAE